jgi:hypothetical protein
MMRGFEKVLLLLSQRDFRGHIETKETDSKVILRPQRPNIL